MGVPTNPGQEHNATPHTIRSNHIELQSLSAARLSTTILISRKSVTDFIAQVDRKYLRFRARLYLQTILENCDFASPAGHSSLLPGLFSRCPDRVVHH